MFYARTLLFVFLMSKILVTQGLLCWRCEQATSSVECLLSGKSVRCLGPKDSCWTSVRRYKSTSLIWKGCKQSFACQSDERQNFFYGLGRVSQCNNDQDSSLCTCCCSTSVCNKYGTCKLQRSSQVNCPTLPSIFRNGAVKCSDSNKPGSICEFTCAGEDFILQPSPEAASSRCLPGGKWSQPEQCCAKPCPPYIPMDYFGLLHAKDEETWNFYVGTLAYKALTSYKHGHDSMRSALIPFSGIPHPEKGVTLNQTANMNSENFLEIFRQIQYTKTADGRVNIGAALTYVLGVLKHHTRDPNRHVEVVSVVSDTPSDDDVTGPAQALRDMGVLTFTRFVRSTATDPYNMTQLLEIAGDKDRVAITDINSESNEDNSLSIQSYVCNKICQLY